MPDTHSLALPLHVPGQAQRHEKHNEALHTLDALVQLVVKDRDLSAPPASPSVGDRYIAAAAPSGSWTGHALDVAGWDGSAWQFHEPREGWRAYVEDEDVLLIFDGAAWVDAGSAIKTLQNLTLLGLGTSADATNPFSAKLNKALWTARTAAEGGDGDLRITLSKETAGDVLSLLLQSGFSGRAEIGLIGDDDVAVKVSPDGSAWVEALRIDKDDAKVTLSGALAAGGDLTAQLAGGGSLGLAATGEGTVSFTAGRYSGDAQGPIFITDKARGSIAAPAAVNNGDAAGIYRFRGHSGSALLAVADIRGIMEETTPGPSAMGARLEFRTNPAGSASIVEVMRISATNGVQLYGANTVFTASRHLRLRQYAAGSLPAHNAGDEIASSDIVGAPLVSDGTQWVSPGVKMLNAVTANTTVSIPAGWAIGEIHFANTTGNAVTGGIRIGTSAGGTDVVAAQAVAGNAIDTLADASILKKVFSRTAAQTLHIQAVTAWNGASVELAFVMRKVF
jgi:hypothetical protein